MDACQHFNAYFNINLPDWPSQHGHGVINTTVGYLLYRGTDFIITCQEMDEYSKPRDVANIPTSLVLAIEILQGDTK